MTLCGELAGKENTVPHLLQMGFRGLSVAPSLIPTTKDAIRKVNTGFDPTGPGRLVVPAGEPDGNGRTG